MFGCCILSLKLTEGTNLHTQDDVLLTRDLSSVSCPSLECLLKREAFPYCNVCVPIGFTDGIESADNGN